MTRNKWITAAAVFALSTSLAVAGDGFGKHGKQGGKGEFSEKFAQKLNLSDSQKQQIRDLQKSFREQNKAAFEQSRQTMQEFRAARKANDTAKIESLRPAVEAQRAQMKQLHDANMQQILSLLTPAQRQQWETLKAERGSKHGKRNR